MICLPKVFEVRSSLSTSELTARWHSVFVTAAWRLVTISAVGKQHHRAQADSKKEHGARSMLL